MPMKEMLMKRLAILVVGLALLVPSSAFAQSSSTCQAYNPELCSVSSQHPTSTSSGTLPFTGLDVAFLAIGGGVLLGTGLVIRRLSRSLD